MLRGISQSSLLARFSRIFAMYRARAHRSQKVTKDCTRSGSAIFDTFGIFGRDQRAIARTPNRQFHCPRAPKPSLVAPALIGHQARVICFLEKPAVLPALNAPFVALLSRTTDHLASRQAPSKGRAPCARRLTMAVDLHGDSEGRTPGYHARSVRVLGLVHMSPKDRYKLLLRLGLGDGAFPKSAKMRQKAPFDDAIRGLGGADTRKISIVDSRSAK